MSTSYYVTGDTMKSYLPCPKCQEHGVVSLLRFSYAYLKNTKHVEASCSKCNFVTFAKLPETPEEN